MFKTILVPTDGSELSAIAIANAVELAKILGARIIGLTVTPPYPYSALSEYIPESQEQYAKRINGPASRHLAVVADAAKAAGVPCETMMRADERPWQAIVDVANAKACDAILMASHGRRGLSGVLLGSETQKVLVYSKVPVIVYR